MKKVAIRKLAVLTVVLVSTLFFVTINYAGQAGVVNGVPPRVGPNDKLLILPVNTKPQSAFEQSMAEAGWDVHKPCNLGFYNVRHMIAKNEIMDLQNELDKKIASEFRASRAVDRSA